MTIPEGAKDHLADSFDHLVKPMCSRIFHTLPQSRAGKPAMAWASAGNSKGRAGRSLAAQVSIWIAWWNKERARFRPTPRELKSVLRAGYVCFHAVTHEISRID